ncbi:hypothetical protein BJ322DRAFT_1048337 [Thelephora terrestris]|uniref:Uncharacterized protein n=1 Tax=Thelephora terrestris TaxID=56493 RepID=A0A9P6HJX8_9AGAM|nr:hypothetical protein BJ322DRAFT_1048337 [Thelephora terrestris]
MSATVLPAPAPEARVHRVDIIDVDLLEDDEIQFVSSSTRLPRSHPDDVIDVDSLPEGIPGPSNLSRYRSPPPRRQRSRPSPIPPVPPLPPHFRRHRPTFRRSPHQIPTLSSGIVLASPQPFAFEERLLGRSRNHTPTYEDAPESSTPSHHVPVMGFGGALIASNNEQQTGHPNRHTRRGSRAVRLLSNSIFSTIPGLSEESRDELFDDGPDGFPAFPDFFPLFSSAYNRLGRFSESTPSIPKSAPEYKRIFTHPPKVAPGFTHDFASSSDVEDLSATGAAPGTSASTLDTVLVCAKCLDPLVMGNVPDSKRLWGLRCGHMLDGKCVRESMRPPDGQEDGDESTTENSGKGKEKAVGEPQDSAPDGSGGSLFGNTLRRLRSGRVVSTTASQSKGKQKQNAEEPKVERVHEWPCPVSGCGRTHKTNLISGVWKPDRSEGAILVYV